MIHQAQMTSDPVKLQQINHFHNYAVYAAIENDTEPRFLQWMYATVPRNFLYHISFGNKTSIFVTFNSSWVLTDPVKATLVNVPIMYLSKINNVEMFSLTSIPAENILSFSRINQSLAFDSTLTALAGDSYQFPNYISSPLMIGDNLDKSLALMVSTGFPRAGITACIGIPTAFGVIVTANVSDGQYVTSCASSNYGGDIESEEEENKMRTRSFKLSYHYIPEYQKRFNGHPWKYFAPPSNHQLLQYSDSDTNSYYESVKLEKKTKYTRKFKQRHAGNQRGHSTVTESQSTGGHETLSIESL